MKLTKEECKLALKKIVSTKVVEILKDEPQALCLYENHCNVLEKLIEEYFSSSIRVGTRGQCKSCESKFLKGISDVEKEVDKYRIALDKACLLLKEATRQVYDIFDEVLEEDEYSWITETEEWKRYLLDEIN